MKVPKRQPDAHDLDDVADEWRGLVTEADLEVYEAAGFGRPAGLGTRPALMIIDVQYRTLGHERVDTLVATRAQYPTACGLPGWEAVDRLVPLLQQARKVGVPVIFPHVAPKGAATAGRVADKNIHIVDIAARGYEFVEELAPRDGDYLVPKDHPSAFFGTTLLSRLIDLGVDTLLVAGATTSGCVRATVVDAFSLNFRVGVIRDGVFDRGQVSHRLNLFDLHSKYADLFTAREAHDYLAQTSVEVER